MIIGILLFSGCDLNIKYDAIETIDKPHAEVHEGESFVLSEQQTINLGNQYNYIIDTTNNQSKVVHLLVLARSSAESSLEIWEGVTYTGGSSNGEVNRNRIINSSPVATILVNPTINTRQTKILEEHFGAGQNLGGESRNILEFVLDINQTYSIEFISEAASNDVSWLIEWYEEDSK